MLDNIMNRSTDEVILSPQGTVDVYLCLRDKMLVSLYNSANILLLSNFIY